MGHMYEPLELDGRYLWHDRDHPLTAGGDYADYLPESVFRNIRGYMTRNEVFASRVKVYASKQSAMEALADALQGSE